MKIGIIGNGFVGQATSLFKSQNTKVYIYDIDPIKCSPSGTTLQSLASCDIVFICVPTPCTQDGECYTKIVESCINDLRTNNNDPHIVVRSTVPPTFCKRFGVNHMPEFLTEKNWEQDFYDTNTWIIGCNDFQNNNVSDFKNKIRLLIANAKLDNKIQNYNHVFIQTTESELIKYTRNAFLAVKVSFFNEIFQFCEESDVSYNTIRRWVTHDPRINSTHTLVPGHDGQKGYSGTCLPKDIQTLVTEFKTLHLNPIMLEASIKRNTTIDRQNNWNNKNGRSFTSKKN